MKNDTKDRDPWQQRVLRGPITTILDESDAIVHTLSLLFGWSLVLVLATVSIDVGGWILSRAPLLRRVLTWCSVRRPQFIFPKWRSALGAWHARSAVVRQVLGLGYLVVGVHLLLSLLMSMKSYRSLR
ncbi:MAG: uncharacterized protein KVP18_000734 [Porospora cf. gigantea A]|uniref:uncharacterized protein n=1 Tax=Porospora cf. gigantea A TaxID=2853593 RepID=UPI00355A56EF|nr:MAG: hypothetical protein KVP18_000734 [Porospora cf. gigantea A]